MSSVSELFEILDVMRKKGPEYEKMAENLTFTIGKEIMRRHLADTATDKEIKKEIDLLDPGTAGLRELLETMEKLHNCGHDIHWITQYVADKYHPSEVSAELDKMTKEKKRKGKGKESFPKLPHFELPYIKEDESLEQHQQELKKANPLGSLVKKQMEMFFITAENIKNICGIDADTLYSILNDIKFPNYYTPIPFAKLCALLAIDMKASTEPILTTHSIVMIDCINEGRTTGLKPSMKEWEEKIKIERDKADAFMEPFLTALNSLEKSHFHRHSLQQIKRERQKEEIARNKAGMVPVIRDVIKDKLTTVVPETIAGKTTDEYLNEVQRLRERLTTYGTFAQHFKKGLETIRYEAPALERRFGFKKAHTVALSIDELYPYEIDIKTFVPVCKFLKFTTQTLIPQLENTFLLLQLKKMGDGTTKEKLEKLSQLSAAEKRKWEEDKNRLEAWIRRLTPVITRELSPNKK